MKKNEQEIIQTTKKILNKSLLYLLNLYDEPIIIRDTIQKELNKIKETK